MEQRLSVDDVERWTTAYLESQESPTPPGDSTLSGIAFMRACGAMVHAIRDAHDGLVFTNDTVSALQRAATSIAFGLGFDGFMSAEEWPRGQWAGGYLEARCAAVLADAGEQDAVLITGALLSQGYDQNGGSGRALPEGYAELLPAIVSSISPTQESFTIPWFSRDGRINTVRTSATVRALAPTLTDAERLCLLGSGDESVSSETVWDYIFFPVASALGYDLSGFEPDRVHEALESFQDTLSALADDPDDEDEQQVLGDAYLAYLVTRSARDLLHSEVGLSRSQEQEHFPWVTDWRPWQLVTDAVWPPTADLIRQANAENGG